MAGLRYRPGLPPAERQSLTYRPGAAPEALIEQAHESITRRRAERQARLAHPGVSGRDRALYSRLMLRGPAQPLDPVHALELPLALFALQIPLTLQLLIHDRAELAIICGADDTPVVLQAVHGADPTFDVTVEPHQPPTRVAERLIGSIQRSSHGDVLPLRDLDSFDPIDPLNRIFGAALPLGGDTFELRYLARPIDAVRFKQAASELTRPRVPLSFTEVIATLIGKGPRIARFEPRLQRQLEERLLAAPPVELLVAISLAGSDPTRLEHKARGISAALASRFDAGHGGLTTTEWRRSSAPLPLATDWKQRPSGVLVTVTELAALYHRPAQDSVIPVAHLKRPPTLLPPELEHARGILLGTHRQHEREVPIHLPVDELRLGHLVALGKTRVGKTTLGHQIVAQLPRLLPEASLCIIDPNGDWALDFAARSVRPDRIDRTYLLELGDTEHPPALPILSPPAGVALDTFIKTTFETFKLIFRDHWSPTRMETIAFKTLAALCQVPGSTLRDVERLYTNPAFRQRLIARLPDADLRAYWSAFDRLSSSEQTSRTDPILNRLSVFTRARAIRNITCRTDDGFDIGAVLAEGADVLISTAGADIRDEADLLIEFLVARLQLAMFARLGTSGRRRPVALAIDESQHLKGPALPSLLSEAAKTGLFVVAMSQFLDQWTEPLANAILGNVGTTVVFAVGPNDSRRLGHALRPFRAEDAEDLDKFEALVKLRVDGRSMPAVDIRTLPVASPRNETALQRIREQTRARFTRPRAEVEREPGFESGQPIWGYEAEDIEEE